MPGPQALGSDTGGGDRFVYSGHAYAIVHVALAIVRTSSPPRRFERADLPQLHMERSLITLRNPHGDARPSA